jgi:guanosine-3',5'-bis(diphosphate) 3'-pyrophosphohydrolase
MFRLKNRLLETRRFLELNVRHDLLVIEAFDLFFDDLIYMHQKGQGLTQNEILQVLQATDFATRKHSQQTRKNRLQTAYIIHPLKVARHLFSVGKIYDSEVVIGGLLHDVVEDTDATLDVIQKLFGYRVRDLVEQVSDNKDLSYKERKRLQISTASKKTLDASLIVLADKLANLMDLLHEPPLEWSGERISNYFLWAQTVVNHLPESNSFLRNAIEEVMLDYWRGQLG